MYMYNVRLEEDGWKWDCVVIRAGVKTSRRCGADHHTVFRNMNSEIFEQLSDLIAPCSQRLFLEAYLVAHQHKFNECFILN